MPLSCMIHLNNQITSSHYGMCTANFSVACQSLFASNLVDTLQATELSLPFEATSFTLRVMESLQEAGEVLDYSSNVSVTLFQDV